MLDLDLTKGNSGSPGRQTLRRLILTFFRNYTALEVEFDGRSAVLTGANGAGKTNLLEAISLLAPGRGLRRTTTRELAHDHGPGTWAVAARLEGPNGLVDLGTGIEVPGQDDESQGRIVRIDRVLQKSTSVLGDYVAVLWLAPDLDGLFRGPAGDRRRFLDRLTLMLDPGHAARVSALERLHRSRNRLLEHVRPDLAWLDAIEHELAEVAIAVAAARLSTVTRLADVIAVHRASSSPFPHAEVAVAGDIEGWLVSGSAIEAEDRYRGVLRALRPRDAGAGRGTFGPHLSDFVVRHGPKGVDADRSSTGEQKALLVGLILAHARLVAETRGQRPLLLLDEIAAHLDSVRRAGLFEELERLGCQAFMTGTDPVMFSSLAGRAQFFDVANGVVVERADH